MIGSLAIGILIAIIGLLIVGSIVFFKLCYVDVPQNAALVVDNEKVFFTSTIVLPYQKKQLIKIMPIQIKTAYTGENGLYSQDNLLLDIVISYTLCLDATPASVLTAINTVGMEHIANANAIGLSLATVLRDTIQQLVKQYEYELLDKDRGKLRRALTSQLTHKLQGYSLTFITIDKIELMPLKELAKQNSVLAKNQEEVRFEWDKQQKQLLEKRLKLLVNQQRELSYKIKKMIEDYQTVISKKIKFFLNREISPE